MVFAPTAHIPPTGQLHVWCQNHTLRMMRRCDRIDIEPPWPLQHNRVQTRAVHRSPVHFAPRTKKADAERIIRPEAKSMNSTSRGPCARLVHHGRCQFHGRPETPLACVRLDAPAGVAVPGVRTIRQHDQFPPVHHACQYPIAIVVHHECTLTSCRTESGVPREQERAHRQREQPLQPPPAPSDDRGKDEDQPIHQHALRCIHPHCGVRAR